MDRYLARRGIGSVVLLACQLSAAAVMLAIALAVSGAQAPHVTAENVAAIVLGVLVLGESITVITLAGIALILAGVALTRRRVKPASDEHRIEQSP
jgi:drug/metabolite transporter (DMT)-like permease